jgi:hypothetical protein
VKLAGFAPRLARAHRQRVAELVAEATLRLEVENIGRRLRWHDTEERLAPEHFNPRGLPKRSFATHAAAERYLLEHEVRQRFHSYQCTVCRCWHLATTRTVTR